MITEFNVPSSDGIHTLCGVVYLPEGEAKGFFHIVHGMTEHIGRYDKIMTDLSREGYICFGFDNLGHGNTAREKEHGFIAKMGGFDLLCRDVKAFSDAVMTEYSNEKPLPYYLCGHSMGSFITRLAVENYLSPDKYIIMGTGGKNPAAGVGLVLAKIIKAIRGGHHISKLLDTLAFGSYNSRFKNELSPDDPSPWLTNDREVRQKYYGDRFCSFKFTVSAMCDLIKLQKDSNRKEWFKKMPRDLPILLVAGSDDPVGNYGKGVRWVYEKLKSSEHDVKCIIYDGARHEILNDSSYERVKTDLLKFIEN